MIEQTHALAALSDLVMPGLAEGRRLTGLHRTRGHCAVYLERGAASVAIKLGPLGAYFMDGTSSGYVEGVPVSRVVDTVGAGDGFAVGVISALLDGLTFEQAVARGTWIGARVVQFVGDCEGLPRRHEIE